MLHTLQCALRIPIIAILWLTMLLLLISAVTSPAYAVSFYQQAAPFSPHSRSLNLTQPQPGASQTIKEERSAPLRTKMEPLDPKALAALVKTQQVQDSTQEAGILFQKIVLAGNSDCSQSGENKVVVPAGAMVTYCFMVVNTGTVTFTTHTVVDEQLGTILQDYPYILTPRGTARSTAFIRHQANVMSTAIFSATWSASNGEETVSDSDTSQVIVPTGVLSATVSKDLQQCSNADTVVTSLPTTLRYCYKLTNTGLVTLTRHTLVDSQAGILLDNETQPLAPGATMTVTQNVAVAHDGISTATWTSSTAEDISATAVATTTVITQAFQLSATVGLDTNDCAQSRAITVPAYTTVVYCYVIENLGNSTLNYHEIFDAILPNYEFTRTVNVGRSVGITYATLITETTVNPVTWQAHATNGMDFKASTTTTVTVSGWNSASVLLYYDVETNKRHDEGEQVYPNVKVTLRSPQNHFFTATTERDGVAHFTKLAEPGIYTLTIDMTYLPKNYMAPSPNQTINVNANDNNVYAIGLMAPPGTDTDGDSAPDSVEGLADDDGDGIPNYLDAEKIYAPIITKEA
ncbi:MAG: hypothetical protein R3C14_43895 [Caldilineaceae bacterium]